MNLARLPALTSALLAALGASIPLPADEVRCTDGTVLIGQARVDGDVVRVATRDGTVTVPRDAVVRIRTDEELAEELDRLRQLAGDRSHAWLEVARRARHWELSDAMWQDLETGLALCAGAPAERARYDEFLAGLESEILPPHRQRASVAIRVRELLHRVRPGVPAAKVAAVEAILANMPEQEAEEALRARARDAASDAQRLAAARAVEKRANDGAERFFWRTAVFDSSSDVRATVARDVVESGRRDTAVEYLAAGFVHADPSVRIRTAEAFARLGGADAVRHLVAAGPAVPAAALPGGSTRAHVAFVTQQAYVRDFNVEVAQASFIADPVVDVLQSGTVLDVTVHSVIAYRVHILTAYRRALQHLTGEDPGADPERWAAWLAERKSAGASSPPEHASR